MKNKLSHFLFHIYVWGILLIPALHHAGYICPHHHAEFSAAVSVSKELSSSEHRHSPCKHHDHVCQICLLAATSNDQPEQTPSITFFGYCFTGIPASEIDRIPSPCWLICEYRGPPSMIL